MVARLTDRVVKAIQFSIRVNDKLASISEKLTALGTEVQQLDRRLIRVETTLELATTGRFRSLPGGGSDGGDAGPQGRVT